MNPPIGVGFVISGLRLRSAVLGDHGRPAANGAAGSRRHMLGRTKPSFLGTDGTAGPHLKSFIL